MPQQLEKTQWKVLTGKIIKEILLKTNIQGKIQRVQILEHGHLQIMFQF
jgi:hypothetical protein